MANESVQFKSGESVNLPSTLDPGTVYVETDTGNMYLDYNNSSTPDRIQIQDNTKLPLTGGVIKTDAPPGMGSGVAITLSPTEGIKLTYETASGDSIIPIVITPQGYLQLDSNTLENWKSTLGISSSGGSGITQDEADARYLQLSGGALTGALQLTSLSGIAAATKIKIDSNSIDFINTSTGSALFSLSYNYAGQQLNLGSGSYINSGGNLCVSATPIHPLQAVSKSYVDSQISSISIDDGSID